MPAVNLAATGKSSSVTNVNSKLIAALETTTFVNMNNMIFIISDGMGQNDVLVAEKYTHNLIMNDMPVYGQHQTVSYAKPGEGNGWITTDSAAAGTALSSGYKTRYTYMGLDVNGNDVKQITEVLREKLEKIIGVVTTGWAYDATPATYGGAHAVRGNNSEVSKEIRSFAPDLFIGAGLNDYSGNLPSGQSIGIYENWSTGIKSTKDKVWISIEKDSTSTDDNVRYTDGSSSARPTISQMMAYFLTWLQAKSNKNNNVGFFLMFENGMTDDAGHNNDLDQKIGELHATDEAVAIALKFSCENPDTVVIVTSDHDTGRLTLGSGWKKDITKAKFGTTGHSKQDVAIYAIGKNTSVFDNQIMYNCQVAKVTAYLFGIKDFGTSESTYDIDDIIAGVKNEVEDATAEEDKVVGKVLSIKASSSTSKMTLTMSNLSINVHDMVSVAIQVPKGATSVKITTNTGEVVASQSLDKTLNYVEDYTYYYLTFKPSENANKLIFEFRGSFSKSDEIWIDDLTIASSCIGFDDYSVSNASGSSGTTVQITTAK